MNVIDINNSAFNELIKIKNFPYIHTVIQSYIFMKLNNLIINDLTLVPFVSIFIYITIYNNII